MKIHKTIRSKGIEDLAYLAGIIDGEGTIGLYWHKARDSYRVKIYVVNTCKNLIDWLGSVFGGYVYERKHNQWKTRYEWHLGEDSMDLLESLIPYLKVKKGQANVILEFRKKFKDKEKRPEYYLRMKELNKRNLDMASCND
jgi:hypothetical protein